MYTARLDSKLIIHLPLVCDKELLDTNANSVDCFAIIIVMTPRDLPMTSDLIILDQIFTGAPAPGAPMLPMPLCFGASAGQRERYSLNSLIKHLSGLSSFA